MVLGTWYCICYMVHKYNNASTQSCIAVSLSLKSLNLFTNTFFLTLLKNS